MTQKNMNASRSCNDFYFITDLDRTLIYSKRAIMESDPENCKNLIPVELKDGKVISYMNQDAYNKLMKLRENNNFKFLPCTMRKISDAMRISFLKDQKYVFADGGVNLYVNGILYPTYGIKLMKLFNEYSHAHDFDWKRENIALHYTLIYETKVPKEEIRIHEILPGTNMAFPTSFEIPYSDDIENNKAFQKFSHTSFYTNGRKIYISPDFIQKDCIYSFTGRNLHGVVSGDSFLDIPMLAAGHELGLLDVIPKHSEITGELYVSKTNGPSAAKDILSFVEESYHGS